MPRLHRFVSRIAITRGPDFVIGAGGTAVREGRSTAAGAGTSGDVSQLTFGGERETPSLLRPPDGKRVIFQATVPVRECDQQYILDLATGATRRVSTGKGRTDRAGTSTTRGRPHRLRPPLTRLRTPAASRRTCRRGTVWALLPVVRTYLEAKPGGGERAGNTQATQTHSPGYDAEASPWLSPRVGEDECSRRRATGDIDLYSMGRSGAT
jgi:hypothetical protein